MRCHHGPVHCDGCHDRMIHQNNRQPDESSSRFGQWIHDEFGRTFFAADIDMVMFKNMTRILRVLEHKQLGGGLSDGQRRILELLAVAVKVLRITRMIDEESGVFIVWADMGGDDWPRSIEVKEVGGSFHCAMEGDDMRRFLSGEHLVDLFGAA